MLRLAIEGSAGSNSSASGWRAYAANAYAGVKTRLGSYVPTTIDIVYNCRDIVSPYAVEALNYSWAVCSSLISYTHRNMSDYSTYSTVAGCGAVMAGMSYQYFPAVTISFGALGAVGVAGVYALCENLPADDFKALQQSIALKVLESNPAQALDPAMQALIFFYFYLSQSPNSLRTISVSDSVKPYFGSNVASSMESFFRKAQIQLLPSLLAITSPHMEMINSHKAKLVQLQGAGYASKLADLREYTWAQLQSSATINSLIHPYFAGGLPVEALNVDGIDPACVSQLKKLNNALFYAHKFFKGLEALNLQESYRTYKDCGNLVCELMSMNINLEHATREITTLDINMRESFASALGFMQEKRPFITECLSGFGNGVGALIPQQFSGLVSGLDLSAVSIGRALGTCVQQLGSSQENGAYGALAGILAGLPRIFTDFSTKLQANLSNDPPLPIDPNLEDGALRLADLLNRTNGVHSISPFDAPHYLAIIQHTYKLSSQILLHAQNLSSNHNSFAIKQVDELKLYLVQLVNLVDKAEIDSGVLQPGFLSTQVMQQLESWYVQIINAVSGAVDFSERTDLRALDNESFRHARLHALDLYAAQLDIRRFDLELDKFFATVFLRKLLETQAALASNADYQIDQSLLKSRYAALHTYMQRIDADIDGQWIDYLNGDSVVAPKVSEILALAPQINRALSVAESSIEHNIKTVKLSIALQCANISIFSAPALVDAEELLANFKSKHNVVGDLNAEQLAESLALSYQCEAAYVASMGRMGADISIFEQCRDLQRTKYIAARRKELELRSFTKPEHIAVNAVIADGVYLSCVAQVEEFAHAQLKLLSPALRKCLQFATSGIPFLELSEPHAELLHDSKVFRLRQLFNFLYHLKTGIAGMGNIDKNSKGLGYTINSIMALGELHSATLFIQKTLKELQDHSYIAAIFPKIWVELQGALGFLQQNYLAEDTNLKRSIHALVLLPADINALVDGVGLSKEQRKSLTAVAVEFNKKIEQSFAATGSHFKILINTPMMIDLFFKLKGQVVTLNSTTHNVVVENLESIRHALTAIEIQVDKLREDYALEVGLSAPFKHCFDELYQGVLSSLKLPSASYIRFATSDRPVAERIAAASTRKAQYEAEILLVKTNIVTCGATMSAADLDRMIGLYQDQVLAQALTKDLTVEEKHAVFVAYLHGREAGLELKIAMVVESLDCLHQVQIAAPVARVKIIDEYIHAEVKTQVKDLIVRSTLGKHDEYKRKYETYMNAVAIEDAIVQKITAEVSASPILDVQARIAECLAFDHKECIEIHEAYLAIDAIKTILTQWQSYISGLCKFDLDDKSKVIGVKNNLYENQDTLKDKQYLIRSLMDIIRLESVDAKQRLADLKKEIKNPTFSTIMLKEADPSFLICIRRWLASVFRWLGISDPALHQVLHDDAKCAVGSVVPIKSSLPGHCKNFARFFKDQNTEAMKVELPLAVTAA